MSRGTCDPAVIRWLAVFDFPDRATAAEWDHVPRLLVDRVEHSSA
jgi:hypothetical protein